MRTWILIVLCAACTARATASDLYLESFEATSPPSVPSGWSVQTLGSPSPITSLTVEPASGNPSQHLQLTADSTNAGATWVAIAWYQWLGTLPTSDMSQLRLTVDVAASENARDLFIHFWSYADATYSTLTGKADWGGTTTTDYSEAGGLLTSFNAGPNTLDTNASAFRIGIRMQSDFGQDNGNTFRIDNVRLSVVPEPCTTLLLCGVLSGLWLHRPRSRAA